MNTIITDAPLVNRIANSDLITFDIESLYPKEPIILFDLKDFLFHGLILKEKEFREALKIHPWENLRGKIVAIHCSTDAIVPMWAYMLVASHCFGLVKSIHYGDQDMALTSELLSRIEALDMAGYLDKKVIIKGCSDQKLPVQVYPAISMKFLPCVKSLMFGEPCSTVPIYKRK
jgi:hypothetical protein